jgi:hypothetical protein
MLVILWAHHRVAWFRDVFGGSADTIGGSEGEVMKK